MPDHYAILGLDPQATGPEIKAAYRSLVRELHPDLRSGEGGTTERLMAVQRAYQVLSHPGRRASYDAGISEGLDGVLGAGGVAEALEDVLTMVRERPPRDPRSWLDGGHGAWLDAGDEAGRGVEQQDPDAVPVGPPGSHREDRIHGERGARGSASTPMDPALGGPHMAPREDRIFLAGVGASVALAGVAGALVFQSLAGPAGLLELLTFLLMGVLAPLLALLTSWVLSYGDGRIESTLEHAAGHLRATRDRASTPRRLRPRPRFRPPLPLLVLPIVSLPHVLVTTGAPAGGVPDIGALLLLPVTVLSGIVFAVLHRVQIPAPRRRLLLAANVLVAGTALGLAGSAWGRGLAAERVAEVRGPVEGALLASLGGVPAGAIGVLLLVVVLYVTAALWHRLADGWQERRRIRVDRSRMRPPAARVAAAPFRGVLTLLAGLLDVLAAAIRVFSLPGTFIRRAIGGGWL